MHLGLTCVDGLSTTHNTIRRLSKPGIFLGALWPAVPRCHRSLNVSFLSTVYDTTTTGVHLSIILKPWATTHCLRSGSVWVILVALSFFFHKVCVHHDVHTWLHALRTARGIWLRCLHVRQ